MSDTINLLLLSAQSVFPVMPNLHLESSREQLGLLVSLEDREGRCSSGSDRLVSPNAVPC
jgi:hypothetical protein